MTKPLVLFSTYASSRLGAGHVFRDLELARLLTAKTRVVFHSNKDSRVSSFIRSRGIKEIFQGSLGKALRETSPDLLIYDRPYDLGRASVTKTSGLKIMALDYYFYDDSNIDCAVNLVNRNGAKKSVNIPKIYEGVKYAIIKDEVARNRHRTKNYSEMIQKIVVIFGGADPQNNTADVLKILAEGGFGKTKITVIMGPLFRHTDEIREYGSLFFGNRIEFLRNIDNVGKIMAGADVVFCAGGTTLMEALSLGRPAIVMPQNEEEADFINRAGIKDAATLINRNWTIEKKIKSVTGIFDNYRRRLKLARQGLELFDGKGKRRIADIVLDLCKGKLWVRN